jgi:hypothetical protein
LANCQASATGGGIYVKKGDPLIYNNTVDGCAGSWAAAASCWARKLTRTCGRTSCATRPWVRLSSCSGAMDRHADVGNDLFNNGGGNGDLHG